MQLNTIGTLTPDDRVRDARIVGLVDEARSGAGMDVPELATLAAVEPRRLYRVLSGQRRMGAPELVRLCLALDLRIDDLAAAACFGGGEGSGAPGGGEG